MQKYEIILYWSNEYRVFIAEVPELPGCITHGDTQEAALANAKEAFKTYMNSFHEVIKDLPYANTVRRVVIWGAYYGFLTPIISIADDHPALRRALFDSVSGKRAYREILLDTISMPLLLKISATIIRQFMKRIIQIRG